MADIRIRHRDTGDEFTAPTGTPVPAGYDIVATSREQIKKPPGVADYIKAGLTQAATEILPMAGLFAGGALGMGAGGPVGAVAGAGLGYATGRQGNRAIGSMLTPETNLGASLSGTRQGGTLPGITGTAGAIGSDLLAGAAIEAASPMGVWLAQKGAQILRAPVGLLGATAEDIAVREAATRQGIPLTAGAASGSIPVATLEAFPTRFPIGGQAAIPMERKIQQGMAGATKKLQNEFGPVVPLERAGQSIQADIQAIARAQEEAPTKLVTDLVDSLTQVGPRAPGKIGLGATVKAGEKQVETLRRAEAHRIYDAAKNGRGMEDVTLDNVNQTANAIKNLEDRLQGGQSKALKNIRGFAETAAPPPLSPSDLPSEAITDLLRTGNSTIRNAVLSGEPINPQSLPLAFIERYGLATTGTRTLEETLTLHQRAAALARSASDDVTAAQFREIAKAYSKDIVAFDPNSTLANAAQFYNKEVARFFGRKAGIRRLLNLEPGAVGDKILSTTSPDLLSGLVETLPRSQKSEVQRAVLERMKDRAIDIRTGEVSPRKLEEEFIRFGDENLSILFGARARDIQALRKTLSTNYGRDTTNDALVKTLTAQPETIVNTLARGRIKSLDDFDAVWGKVSIGTRQEMRSALYDEVLQNSVDPATGIFSMQRYATQVERVPKEIWDRMLTGNPAAAFNDLLLVARRMNTFARAVANPSGTAQGIFGPGQIMKGANIGLAAAQAGVAGLVGNELGRGEAPGPLEVFGVLSPLALGLLIYSKGGQKALTSPIRRPINLMGTGASMLKGLGVIGNEQRDPSVPSGPPIP